MKKCPQCAEKVQSEAKVCRHCGYEFTAADNQDAEKGRLLKALLWIGLAVFVLAVYRCDAGGGPASSSVSAVGPGAASSTAPTPGNSVELKRFTWQNSGDAYCKASATITNTSAEDLNFLKVTLQFLKGEQLVGTSFAYAEIKSLAPGQQTTWDDMYECPGRGTTVEITATSNEGGVSVLDPPSKSAADKKASAK